MQASAAGFDDAPDPLLALEAAAEHLGWACLRADRAELLLSAELESLTVQLSAQWRAADELLQVAAMWDMPVPPARRADVAALVQLANTRLSLGHFELWGEEVVFRHAQMMAERDLADEQRARRLLRRVAQACAQYHPAFQFVIWAGKKADEALAACLFETAGEA